MSELLNIDVHILGVCLHICAKYEVSMSNNVARRTVHTQHWHQQWHQHQQWHWQRWTKHDCIGSLVDKPNEPKSSRDKIKKLKGHYQNAKGTKKLKGQDEKS